MQRSANPGKLRRTSKLTPWLAAAALALAGCSGTHKYAKTFDPLVDGTTPGPAQGTSPLQATTPPAVGLPPIPQSSGLTTNAALAAQTPRPQSLMITQDTGWARKRTDSPAAAPGLPVSQPKARVVPIPEDKSITAPSTAAIKQTAGWTASASAAPSKADLDAQLKSRGVVDQKQALEVNGIRLSVAVKNAANPNTVDNYSTIAPDYATAVAAIIREIDAKRAHP